MEPSSYLGIFWNASGKESAPDEMLAELKVHIIKHYHHSSLTLLAVFLWLWLCMREKKKKKLFAEAELEMLHHSFQERKKSF